MRHQGSEASENLEQKYFGKSDVTRGSNQLVCGPPKGEEGYVRYTRLAYIGKSGSRECFWVQLILIKKR